MPTHFDIDQLSVSDKLALIEEIWNSIPEGTAEFPLSGEHARILDARLDDHRRNPNDADAWDVVKSRILANR